MKDFENEIFTYVSSLVREKYPKANIVSEEFSMLPETFPAISIIEMDNFFDTETIDSDSKANYFNLVYEVNVYSNLKTRKKQQAKEIVGLIDEQFMKLKFTRTSKQPYSIGSRDYYRYVARYKARISKDGVIY